MFIKTYVYNPYLMVHICLKRNRLGPDMFRPVIGISQGMLTAWVLSLPRFLKFHLEL